MGNQCEGYCAYEEAGQMSVKEHAEPLFRVASSGRKSKKSVLQFSKSILVTRRRDST